MRPFGLMALELSGLAQSVFLEAGFSPDEEPDGTGALAVALFGRGRVTYGPASQIPAFVVYFDPCTAPARLFVREDLVDEELTMAVARGVARWWQETHLVPALSEGDVEELAIALALPERGFMSSAARCGCDEESLAYEFVCPLPIVRQRLRQLLRHRSGTHVRSVHVV